MDSPSSSLTIPPIVSSTTSSSGRNKIGLKPGRSLMDWIRLTHSGKDLSETGGKTIEVSPRELAKHNKANDAWIALRGKVYNITHYLEYHPGGEEELMRGAGRDATDLFNQVHRWVNAESMLQKCFVGVLKKSWSLDVTKLYQIKPFKLRHKKPIADDGICELETSDEPDKIMEDESQIKSEWSVLPSSQSELKEMSIRFDDSEDTSKLLISSSSVKLEGLITYLVEKELYVKINSLHSHFVNIVLSTVYQEHYKVGVQDETIQVILLRKNIDKKDLTSQNFTASQSIISSLKWTPCTLKTEFIFWPCKLISKITINHNTFLYTLLLPASTKMWIPLGQHVQIKSNIEGTDIVRSYTPVCSSLNQSFKCDDKLDGRKIVLMIKIYSSGTLTPVINRCSLGDCVNISNYAGNFSETFIQNSDSIVMIAAGTGITPMIRIINWAVTNKNSKRILQLLFFNKTEDDILWKKELEDCRSTYNDFQIAHILSEPSARWQGYTGQINRDILEQLITIESSVKQRILICGPLPFTQTGLSCLTEAGFNQEDVYAFTGS